MLESSKVYSIFKAEHCLFILFHFITHSSYKFSPIEKKEKNYYMNIPHVKSRGPEGKAPGSSRCLQHIQCKILADLLHFSTFFLHIFTYLKKVGGGGLYGPFPPVKKWREYIPHHPCPWCEGIS